MLLMTQSLSGGALLLESRGVKVCLLGSLDRCRSDCGCEGALVAHKPMRARPVPKDAYLGTDECDNWSPVSHKMWIGKVCGGALSSRFELNADPV